MHQREAENDPVEKLVLLALELAKEKLARRGEPPNKLQTGTQDRKDEEPAGKA
jgi:hypothetical protein